MPAKPAGVPRTATMLTEARVCVSRPCEVTTSTFQGLCPGNTVPLLSLLGPQVPQGRSRLRSNPAWGQHRGVCDPAGTAPRAPGGNGGAADSSASPACQSARGTVPCGTCMHHKSFPPRPGVLLTTECEVSTAKTQKLGRLTHRLMYWRDSERVSS